MVIEGRGAYNTINTTKLWLVWSKVGLHDFKPPSNVNS